MSRFFSRLPALCQDARFSRLTAPPRLDTFRRTVLLLQSWVFVRACKGRSVVQRAEAFECVFLELTNRCNFNCAFCPNPSMTRPQGQMEEALARRLLDELAEKGLCRWVNLSLMGEPLLHPRLLAIAEHGVRLGLPIHLITNLSLLTRQRMEALLDLPIAHLALSLQTASPEDFRLKAAPGRFSFEQSMAIVEQAVRIKIARSSPTEISIHLLTTRLERPRAKALLESTRQRLGLAAHFRNRARAWAQGSSLAACRMRPIRDPLCFWLGLDGFVPLLPGVNLCFKRATLWANTLLKEGASVEARRKGTCQLALDTLGILWEGSLTLCCLDFDGVLSFAKVSQITISEALRSEGYQNLRSAFEQYRLPHAFCQHCRGRVTGPSARELLPGSLPVLIGEGWKYLGRFRLRRTLRRIPQELSRYLIR
jgi:organic radical activating enzyme